MTVKERPILFTGSMVQALLSGKKNQTRRVAKLTDAGHVKEVHGHRRWHPADPDAWKACPYGYPVERLWVREAFAKTRIAQSPGLGEIYVYRDGDNRTDYGGPWKPSIHMPRVASRILLEVHHVRIERLNDISKENAIAEGLSALTKDGKTIKYGIPDSDGLPGHDDLGWHWCEWHVDPIRAYAKLWESINGAGSWEANPLVWVVDFRRVTP